MLRTRGEVEWFAQKRMLCSKLVKMGIKNEMLFVVVVQSADGMWMWMWCVDMAAGKLEVSVKQTSGQSFSPVAGTLPTKSHAVTRDFTHYTSHPDVHLAFHVT